MSQSFATGTLVETLCELDANAELGYRTWSGSFDFKVATGTILVYEGEAGAFMNWRGPDVVFCGVPEETHRKFSREWFGEKLAFLHEVQLYKTIRVNCIEPQKCFRISGLQ